jgi:peptide-methionine (S)-S-oxide reductase
VKPLPSPYREAVAAIDAGDAAALSALLDANPSLADTRIEHYGEGYFERPYLLWFVAGNPVRNERLPPNIGEITRSIIGRVQKPDAQVHYALELVCSGRVPRESGVQRELIDVLCDAGADPSSAVVTAVAHRESDAVSHLLEHGAPLTLLAAIATGAHERIPPFVKNAPPEALQYALTAAALYGDVSTISLVIDAGADIDAYSPENFHRHATPLHQAVYYGHLDVVRALVEAGARLDIRDHGYQGTPLEWAEYAERTEIAQYLRSR